jgi:hypothetical protein
VAHDPNWTKLMNKAQLVNRISERVSERYGLAFTESLFDDLAENGLIPPGQRQGNDGKRPIYDFGRASYRRALQIARLRSRGIIRRDAIRVRLFLAGYSEPVFDVREALCREYVACSKSLLHQIRSGYADNQKRVPLKHKKALMRKIGPHDTRFEAADLGISSDQTIELIRTAKQDTLRPQSNSARDKLRDQLLGRPSFQDLPKALLKWFSGLLMFNPEHDVGMADVGQIEYLIVSADDDSFLLARERYRTLVRSGFANVLQLLETTASPEDKRIASDAAALAVREQPEFAATVLVQCLLAIESSGPLRGKKMD